MKALLIAEKPDLMRKVQAVYNKYGNKDTIFFKSFAGHTMKLISPDKYKEEWKTWKLETLPMIPDKFIYEPTPDKLKLYKELKEIIEKGNFDYIINCCDPGREGEHIFFSFYDTIGCKLPVKRMWHSDLTENELNRALTNMRDSKEPALDNMAKASKLRAYFDWLIGMNYSRAFSITSGAKVNIGRVMTPTLKIIVDRELEINNFKPKNFWEVEANFGQYKGIYFNEDKETQFFDKTKAEKIISELQNTGTVIDIIKTKVSKQAPELHSLANLQNEANKVYGYTMNETLEIAQNLYEKQLLSYPRTDSSHLTTSLSKEFKKLLTPLLNINELTTITMEVMNNQQLLDKISKTKKYVDDKKVSDHYAITPTGLAPNFNALNTKEQNIYMLVCKRFLSIFLPPMITNKTIIITENNCHKFKTNGSILEDIGFMKIYNFNPTDNPLPNLNKNDKVPFIEALLLEKVTIPPLRYTDETLNKSMEGAGKFIEDEKLKEVLKETKGLGTPATRGSIVEKLVKLNMIERKKKCFFATNYGIEIIKGLGNNEIVSAELTGVWEQKLKNIEACTYSPNDFYKEMIEHVKEITESFKKMKVSIISNNDKTSIGICPCCGKEIRESPKAYYCSGYKREEDGTLSPGACGFVVGKIVMGAKISITEIKKILTNKETKELNFKIIKEGKPKEWTAKLIFNKETGKLCFSGGDNSSKEVICKCPKCNGNLVESNKYYLCTNYKKTCDMIIGKEICGAKITTKDIKKMMAGKETDEKIFIWKSGKSGKATLKYSNKLDFVFK